MFGILASAFALLAATSQAQAPEARPAESDAALQQKMERIIQSCIQNKTASPYICRASAYATALSEGYSRERAARLTNFKPK